MRTSKMLLTVLFCAVSWGLFAQEPDEKNERIEALKVSFITNKLSLTSAEAQKFWPVYNQFEAERKAAKKSWGTLRKESKADNDVTEAEADKIIQEYVQFKSKEAELAKKYVVEFKKVLPIKKVATLLTLEEQFKKMLLGQMRGEHGGAAPVRPGMPRPAR